MADISRIATNSGLSFPEWAKNFFYNNDVLERQIKGMSPENAAAYKALFEEASNNPFSAGKLTVGGKQVANTGLGTTAGLALNKMKAHPFKTLGLGALGATNVAGLFDNNKIGGQLAGTVIGGATPFLMNKFMNTKFGLPGKLGFAMLGGGVGSLFDKLMAKKEQEQSMYNRYQGQY